MYDVTIIGCGVIGAAAAYELSRRKLRVLVLERENDVAMGTSRANSAIIHAGYDAECGTLMARLNVEGNAMAGEICEKLDVPFKRIGSLVAAFDDHDEKMIRELYERGVKNGVPDLRLIDAEETRKMEPNIAENVRGALYAPTAGVICPWEYTLAFIETAVRNGVELKRECEVTAIEKSGDAFTLSTTKGDIRTRFVVNAAGVHSQAVHEMFLPHEFTIHPVRGEYDLLDKSEGTRCNTVVFQCPGPEGKGVLVSPTVHGNLIVGPSAEEIPDPDDTATTAEVLAMVRRRARRAIPSVDLRQCIRNFAGVRANSDRDDFIIEEKDGFVDLAGIKSPGLTAAPAIACYAVDLLEKAGLAMEKKESFIDARRRVRFAECSQEERARLVKENPAYGRVICRCNTITEGEILDALHSPVPPVSVDGVKRRAGTGMGRCQGGFCGPRVVDILARELHKSPAEILQDADGSVILTGTLRGEERA